MKALISLAVGVASMAAVQAVPSELSALTAAAKLDRPVAGWCRGEFRSGRAGAYVVAIAPESGAGRYLVLEPNAAAVELSSFAGKPDLSCYTPTEARQLSATIGASRTIQGEITLLWTTTVVCGFVENTRAVCWQYSPVRNVFVKVGEWDHVGGAIHERLLFL